MNYLFGAIVFVMSSVSAAATLKINTPVRIGLEANKPFIYLVPVSGGTGFRLSSKQLPAGLVLDVKTGIISGTPKSDGLSKVQLSVKTATQTVTKTVEFLVSPKSLALTPVMGWNPWYVWGCTIDDAKIRQAADLLVSSGLAAHGYNYINLDDCWQGKRTAEGKITSNSRFPNMKALADYVHSKGLRIGIYTSPGPKTCAGYEGTRDADYDSTFSTSYLDQDVQTYADWGMDLVKYDWCIFPKDKNLENYYWRKQPALYQRMSEAITRSSRSMVHMMCQYGRNDVWEWGASHGGNSWRTDDDLADDWRAILRSFGRVEIASFSGPGHWNDLDMLMVGKGNWPAWKKYEIPTTSPRPTKLTLAEQQTHLSLWSLMASPLLFSGDLAQIDAVTLSLLTNDDVLAVNQDVLGAPVKKIASADSNAIILTRQMKDGSLAVALFNLDTAPKKISVSYTELGLAPDKPVTVRDLWNHTQTKSADTELSATLPEHGVYFVNLSL